MPNYLVVLILSVFVLLGALYVHTVERRIIQMKHELSQQTNEKLVMKVEFESTEKKLTQELESTRKELKRELESTRKELKKVHEELKSTRDVLRKEIIEKNNARGEELGIVREDVNALFELMDSKIKKAPRTTQGCLSGVYGDHACPAPAYITFNPPFTAVPALVYGLYAYNNNNFRLVTLVSNLSKSGFNIQISSWGETSKCGVRISWMACPKSSDI